MTSGTSGPTAAPVRKAWWAVGITALLGIGLTVFIEHHALKIQRAQLEQYLEQEADTLRGNVEDELRIIKDVLDSIRALHAVSDEISPAALDEFVERGMVHQRSVLGGFGFAQRISHRLRQALEEAHHTTPKTGYLITEWSSTDEAIVTAEPRPVYFPLTWQDSVRALQVPNGFDFGGFPPAADAVRHMLTARQPVIVSQPIPGHTPPMHWIFSPIFYEPRSTLPEPIPPTFISFSVGLLDPARLLQQAAERSGLSPAFHYALTPPPHTAEEVPIHSEATTDWHYVRDIPVLDHHWTLTVHRPAMPLPARLWTVLLAGLSITGLITSQLAWIADRHRRVTREVQLRTRELQAANSQLATEMRERSRLEKALREATEEERRQLGRDLHDSLGQKLTGAVYLSRSLANRMADQDPVDADHARQLNATLKESVQQVRALAHGLAPIELQAEGLADALPQLADEITGLFAIPCTVHRVPDAPWPTSKVVQEALYLIAREAAYNAVRHGKPHSLAIHWQRADADHMALTIVDDGSGLPDPVPEGHGLGIHSMRQRALGLQADLRLEPNTPQGTRVICRCPNAHIYSAEVEHANTDAQ